LGGGGKEVSGLMGGFAGRRWRGEGEVMGGSWGGWDGGVGRILEGREKNWIGRLGSVGSEESSHSGKSGSSARVCVTEGIRFGNTLGVVERPFQQGLSIMQSIFV